jgi:hypothetical protein
VTKYENNGHDLCCIIIAIFINWIWRYPSQNGHSALWKSKPKPSECDTVLVRHWATESCRVVTDCNVIPSVSHDRLFNTFAPILEFLSSSFDSKRSIRDWGQRVCFSSYSFIALKQRSKPLPLTFRQTHFSVFDWASESTFKWTNTRYKHRDEAWIRKDVEISLRSSWPVYSTWKRIN